MISQEDWDVLGLVEAALATHVQLSRDIGASMSCAILSHRQIWFAQTSLPDNFRKELTYGAFPLHGTARYGTLRFTFGGFSTGYCTWYLILF